MAKRSGLLSSFLGGAERGDGRGVKIEFVDDDAPEGEIQPPQGDLGDPGDRPAGVGASHAASRLRGSGLNMASGGALGDEDDDGLPVEEAEIVSPGPNGPQADGLSGQSDGSLARDISVVGQGTGVADFNGTGHPGEDVYTTGFSDVANARLWRRTKEARRRSQDRQRSYRDIFTPTRPKRKSEEFLGRRAIIGTVVEAIEEECAHVVLCGEHGLGKTSLANVVTSFARNSGYLVARVTGTADLTFSSLIRTIFEELFDQIEETPAGSVLWERLGVQDLNELLNDNAMDMVSEFLGEESLSVNRVIRALNKLSDNQAIVIIDDYEQIQSKDLKTKLCQVMKALSDQGGWLSFFILGRADSPSELLQDDIEGLPNAVGVYIDPFSLHEIEEVILEGSRRVGVPFNDDTIQAIARLSQGVPNVLQWLCFLSARRASRRQGVVIEMEDLANIVSDAVTKIDSKLRNQYDEVCRFEKGRDNADLLYLAVRAPCTTSGLFSANAMAVLSKQILGKKWKEAELHTALLPLCGKGKTGVLRKLDTSEGTFYRFAHPAMRAVVMLKKIVRIPLLADSRTRDVDAAYLPASDMEGTEGEAGPQAPPAGHLPHHME